MPYADGLLSTGERISCALWYLFSGFLASLGGSLSSVARLPRLTAARPSLGGGLMRSNQALE